MDLPALDSYRAVGALNTRELCFCYSDWGEDSDDSDGFEGEQDLPDAYWSEFRQGVRAARQCLVVRAKPNLLRAQQCSDRSREVLLLGLASVVYRHKHQPAVLMLHNSA